MNVWGDEVFFFRVFADLVNNSCCYPLAEIFCFRVAGLVDKFIQARLRDDAKKELVVIVELAALYNVLFVGVKVTDRIS